MKKKLTKVTILALMMSLIMMASVFAGTITSSGVSVITVTKGYEYYAKGYTTSSSRHYTTVQLNNGAIGSTCAQSKRKYGTGKVTAKTKTISTFISCTNYYGRVFYGF